MHIVIIGNGVAGTTAARFIRKISDHKITLISDENKYLFSRTALMYVYMGHTRWQDIEPYEPWFWGKNKIELCFDRVTKIDTDKKSINLKNGNAINYDKLILATGSQSNKFGWPGQDLEGVSGLYHKQDLEKIEKLSSRIQHAAIVGGGLIGIEMAEMFVSRGIHVSLIVRESSYWSNVLPPEESEIINEHIREHKVDLTLNASLLEIKDNGNGHVGEVVLSKGEAKSCQFVGITAGVSPNIDLIRNTAIETQKGILVNEYLQTNMQDIYAIGDCAQLISPKAGRKNIEAVWYTGRMMGEVVAHNVCGKTIKYDPGIWFNSAKFFDIEYQVYGFVPVEERTEFDSILWIDKIAKKSIRIVYNIDNQSVVGFNLLGIRYRHEVCDKWIRENTNIEKVLEQLNLANFDTEFFKTYEKELVANFNKKTGKSIKLKSKKSLSAVLAFLKK